MPFYPCAHASHSLWTHAVKQVAVQLSAQASMQNLERVACLGVVYISQAYAKEAGQMVAMLSKALPQVQHWVGCTGHTVIAGDMDYGSAGSIAAMLLYMPAHHYRVFSGAVPPLKPDFIAQCALVHGGTFSGQSLEHLSNMALQLQCQHMLGGLTNLPVPHTQWAWGPDVVAQVPASIGGGGLQTHGLSGVVFGQAVSCLSVRMQACKPQGPSHVITKMDGDVVLELDGKSALEVIGSALANEGAGGLEEGGAINATTTLVAVAPQGSEIHSHCIGPSARVLCVTGVDVERQGVVLQGRVQPGHALTLCAYNEHAARSEMRRACAQVWESLTSDVALEDASAQTLGATGRSICGAIYIRNHARQRMPQKPQIDAELQMIRQALGPVPLLGFTSSHEVDGVSLQHLSAQLLVFTQPLTPLS